MSTIEIMMPFEGHAHLRQGQLMKPILRFYLDGFLEVVIEPNLSPRSVLDVNDLIRYYDEVCFTLEELGAKEFYPLFLFQVTEETTHRMVTEMCRLPYCVGGKSYYWGTTTHSETGIKLWRRTLPALMEIREQNKVSQQHGEMPLNYLRVSWMRREQVFFEEIAPGLLDEVPGLKISFEHLSTKFGVDFVNDAPSNVHGGITPHHADITMDDVEGGLLQPHLFCKPHAKDYSDRDAIRAAMLSGDPKFHFASDNATHIRSKKECVGGCAGVFLGPVIPQRPVQVFVENNAADKIDPFMSINGRRLYNRPIPTQKLKLVNTRWRVESSYPSGVTPEYPGQNTDLVSYLAGQDVGWQIVKGE